MRYENVGFILTYCQCAFIVHLLTFFSLLNALYTFYRKRHYRLFETSVDAPPSTPSAQRVRVDSSPMASSPLRFLSKIIAATTAESRAHPDATRDVWEIAVWDPIPLSLRLFCLFSPGHVLVYWLFLPTTVYDPRPSTTVLTTIFLGVLLSVQLSMLQSEFSQQSKDTAVIHKEVLHEYDVKYVHPRTSGPVRDVGTQYDIEVEEYENTVETYTPTTIINRGYRTNPNPNYARHIDPDGVSGLTPDATPKHRSKRMSGNFYTPASVQPQASAAQRPGAAVRQPQFRSSGEGGSLGVFSHSNSPLRKAASTNQLGRSSANDGGLARQLALGGRGHAPTARHTLSNREGSPLKNSSVPGGKPSNWAQEQRYAEGRGLSARRDNGYY